MCRALQNTGDVRPWKKVDMAFNTEEITEQVVARAFCGAEYLCMGEALVWTQPFQKILTEESTALVGSERVIILFTV